MIPNVDDYIGSFLCGVVSSPFKVIRIHTRLNLSIRHYHVDFA